MKFLLAAINAKYIHSNPGIYSLKCYAEKLGEAGRGWSVEIGEYTINHQMEDILADIYRRKPDAVGFSCYIWNIGYVMELVQDLHKILQETDIWLGGPEVSYDARPLMEREKNITGIMMGEGERTFALLLEALKEPSREDAFSKIPGLAFRRADQTIQENPPAPFMEMSRIPFYYGSLEGFEHRIVYYESSRGCPFSCSYCLSSIDKSVRFRDLELVKKELQFFLDRNVPQVKFVDRTFNCKKSHSMEIWKYILKHDNKVTNFHFEISADLLDEEELELMRRMRPGLIQLEIGVQSTNPRTIEAIRRKMDLKKLKAAVDTVNSFHNIHQHLDLIAGLPYEDYGSFRKSFDDVYRMRPSQLQLGFLKVLKGSYMMEMAGEYGLTYKGKPPYEVLSTRWLSFDDIIKLKGIEEMVEVYYNSGQFSRTMEMLGREFEGPFVMYEELAAYYDRHGLLAVSHSRPARYEILFDFIRERLAAVGREYRTEEYRDSLMYDLYLRENVKSRPGFAGDQSIYKNQIKDFFISEAREPKYLKGYENYDSRQISKMVHIEVMSDGRFILFDYLNRDALFGNAASFVIETDRRNGDAQRDKSETG